MTEQEARTITEYILASSWTEEGVRMWFDRPRHQLEMLTPNQIIETGDYQRVIDLAEAGRDMGCS